jgi:hypothetical protein
MQARKAQRAEDLREERIDDSLRKKPHPSHRRKFPGIYSITFCGMVYIGAASNIWKRWREHMSRLRRGQHLNAAMSAAYAEHGMRVFVFQILEVVELPDFLHERERWHISHTANCCNHVAPHVIEVWRTKWPA